jgi:hypothetical protein
MGYDDMDWWFASNDNKTADLFFWYNKVHIVFCLPAIKSIV